MEITSANFMNLLNDTVSEQLIVLSQLKEIEQDTPDTHNLILQLNGRATSAWDILQRIMVWITTNKPSPEVVGTKLVDSFQLISAIIIEKTRIVEATPRIIYNTNDDSSQN